MRISDWSSDVCSSDLLNREAFTSRETIVASLVITVLAVATKFVGCGLASIRLGLRRAAQIGIGMAPRGEVGIVVAQIGLGLGVISDPVFAIVLFMAVATTMIAPPLLVRSEEHTSELQSLTR